ncbi:YchF/TatD family DNA exonuclease [Buchnera aphidicola (Neophyllaphis podocarpi)]|uniref:TatD family hydrolase n=1 Tax=Buchnera aphidicola TaxID=9 RepID=UPI0031B880DD
MFLVDSHCHISNLDSVNSNILINNIINRAFKKNIKFILAISTSIEDFYKIKEIIKNKKNIKCSCGIHPSYINDKEDFTELKKISKHNLVIAIGETGLDYYKCYTPKKKQQNIFRKHIKIAYSEKKPLIVHTRNAIQDTLSILKEEKAEKYSGVIHCFNEDIIAAKNILDMNFYISFSGIITFKNTNKFIDIIKFIPMNKILIETDSPYLSPEPYRGIKNEPSFLIEIAKKIAIIKNKSINEIAKQTTKNFFKLFNKITNFNIKY